MNFGKLGEDLACKYLQANGYSIIERNFRSKCGEIDIIVQKNNILTFIEVKTRAQKLYGNPADAILAFKEKHIYRTAQVYIFFNQIDPKTYISIDVIEVKVFSDKTYKINHIKNAIVDNPYNKHRRKY